MKAQKTFLEANLTKEDLIELVPPRPRRAKIEKHQLIDEAMATRSWPQILSFTLSPERLEWWQTLFLRSLTGGPRTKKEILSDRQVDQVLSKVKAEGLDSDLSNFLSRKLVLLAKYGFITHNRSGRSWAYALGQLIEDGTRRELSHVTVDKVMSRFHTSAEYAFINRYQTYLRRRNARRDAAERPYIPPVNPDIEAKPPSHIDEKAQIRRIVAFSDYRIQDVQLLLDFVGSLNPKPDLILYGGDDVARFGPYPLDVLQEELGEADCPPFTIRRPESGAYIYNLNMQFDGPRSATEALADVISQDLSDADKIRKLVVSSFGADTDVKRGTRKARLSMKRAGFSTRNRNFHVDEDYQSFEVEKAYSSWDVSIYPGKEDGLECNVRSMWPVTPWNDPKEAPRDSKAIADYIAKNCVVLTPDSKKSKKALFYNPVETRNFFEELARKSTYGLCAVIGNDDYNSVSGIIKGTTVFNVHESPIILGDYAVIGMEGSPSSPEEPGIGMCLYTEDDVKKHLESFHDYVRSKKLIVVSHAPPRGVLDHAVRFGRRDIGSTSLRDFVQSDESVKMVVCGHVHRCGGMASELGHSLVVNAASHDNYGEPGRVAIIDTDQSGGMHVEWHLMHELSGIFGIGPKTLDKLHSVSVTRLEDLLRMEISKVSAAINVPVGILERFAIQAKAMVTGKPLVLSRFQKPVGRMLYLDIETNLDQSLVWLVGIYSESRSEFKSFFAEDENEEKKVLSDLVKFASSEPQAAVGFYACTGFDRRVLESRLTANGLPTDLCGRMVDLCLPLRKAIAFPLKSYGIKSLAGYFGYEYSHPDLDGFGVALLYMDEYQNTHDQSLQVKMLEYNKDDVMFLKQLTDSAVSLTRFV